MKKNYFLSFLLLAALASRAQLVNNGGTITIQQGAYLVCTGNLSNSSGTITNDGRIEVQGNFVNAGTYNSTANEDSLILSGAGSATLTPGSGTINFLTINKAANTDAVNLGGNTLVSSKLDYLAGALATGSYVLTAPRTAVFNFAAGREIAGSVKRTGWASGAAVLFNAAQMQVTTNGGVAPTDVTVTMLPQASGGDPTQNEREVKRKFTFAQTGGSGFTADVRFPYAATELNTNTEGNLVPWSLVSSEWTAKLTPVTRDAGNKWVATTGIDPTAFGQEWKLADPKYGFSLSVFLRGSWNQAAGNMNTQLNTAGLLPTTQPFNVAPFSYAGTESVPAIPNANVVDWVLVDFRKPASGVAADANSATSIGQKAGFLLKNGSVVDLDGVTPLTITLGKQGAGFAFVRHRNHLTVMSNPVPSKPDGTVANDFTSLANVYTKAGLSNTPLQPLPGSSKYGLWAGNANRDGVINASDIGLIKSQVNAAASGYQFGDANMDGTVNASDIGLTKLSINAAAAAHASRISASNNTTTSHAPVN